MNAIPQFLNNYRVYNGGNALPSGMGDITLPNFDAVAETISGAGILGEFDSSVPGNFKSQNLEISFRTIDKTMFQIQHRH